MNAHLHAGNAGSILWAAVMWQMMMIGMMAPVTIPWLRAVTSFGDAHSAYAQFRERVVFAGGYFVVWAAYSVIAAAAQIALREANLFGEDGALPQPLAGALFVAAGLFQFSPIKGACLKHCRNPFSFFLARWRSGSPGLFRMGISHGMYCVACCWALMATAFAVGVMSLAWMGAIMLAACAEQMSRQGERIAVLVGIALTVWGVRLVVVS